MKIVEYVFFAGEPEADDKFIDLINSKIKEGWQPLGGVCSSKSYVEPDYEVPMQAMVKYENC